MVPARVVPTGTAHGASSACNAGEQQSNSHKREWCPASLVIPAALRRAGWTETLTQPLTPRSTEQLVD